MSDLISREAVIEIVNNIRDCISVEGYWAILERIKALSVEPQEGEWLFEPTQNSNNPWKCSCCGHRAGRYKYKTYKFCPWCGAKMKGE